MALPSSGPISFSQMRSEFGPTQNNNSLSLGSYRISQDVGTLEDLPLDTGIPQSGTIKSSDLLGKKLNVVVDLFSGSSTTRVNARSIYDAQQEIVVVGGFKSNTQVPSAGTGSRIIANVNKQIGSAKGNRNNVALKTGQWGSGAVFDLVIGPSGGIYGAGGDGGVGGGIDSNFSSASNGGQGTSALGIQYPSTVVNQGVIIKGWGGGGGGAGGYGWTFADVQDGCEGLQNETLRIGGGGGAGGRGFPEGNGGTANTQAFTADGATASFAGNGTPGNISSNGSGGAGGSSAGGQSCNRGAYSGSGGSAESFGNPGDVDYGNRGSGGQSGYGIIIDATGSIISRTGNDPVGDIVNNTVL